MKVSILLKMRSGEIVRFIAHPKFYDHMKNAKSAIVYALVITTPLLVSSTLVVAQKKQSKAQLEAEVAKWKQAAEEATARANAAEKIAAQAQKEAEISRTMAEKAEAAASRARYIAQAKAMALKSIELSSNPEQQALVAMQAYKFNLKYKGNPYDNDIYNGLRQALVNAKVVTAKSLAGGNIRVLISSGVAVFSGGDDGMILKWTKDSTGWKPEKIVGAQKKATIFAMDVSPDGSVLTAAEGSSPESKNHRLMVYDLKNPSNKARKFSGFSRIKSIAHTPQGDRAYVIEEDGKSIKLTDFKSVREVVRLKERINVVALSVDGTLLAGGGASGQIYVWNSLNSFSESILYKGQSEITAVTRAPDSQRILVGDSQGRIFIKTMGDTTPPRILAGHVGSIRQIVFNSAGTLVATVADDGIRVWNFSRLSDPPIVLKDDKMNRPLAAIFSPDDQQLLIANSVNTKGSISVWPTKMTAMSESLCSYLSRNMTKDEWGNFAGSDLPYEQTCENLPRNDK